MEQLMKGQRAGRIFATAGKVVAAINSGYKAIIRTPNGSTEVAAIVRCKDCKHFGRYYGDSKKGVCEKLNIIGRPEEWFCADGKRKE